MSVVKWSTELIEQQTTGPDVVNTAETVSEHSQKLIDMAGIERRTSSFANSFSNAR